MLSRSHGHVVKGIYLNLQPHPWISLNFSRWSIFWTRPIVSDLCSSVSQSVEVPCSDNLALFGTALDRQSVICPVRLTYSIYKSSLSTPRYHRNRPKSLCCCNRRLCHSDGIRDVLCRAREPRHTFQSCKLATQLGREFWIIKQTQRHKASSRYVKERHHNSWEERKFADATKKTEYHPNHRPKVTIVERKKHHPKWNKNKRQKAFQGWKGNVGSFVLHNHTLPRSHAFGFFIWHLLDQLIRLGDWLAILQSRIWRHDGAWGLPQVFILVSECHCG